MAHMVACCVGCFCLWEENAKYNLIISAEKEKIGDIFFPEVQVWVSNYCFWSYILSDVIQVCHRFHSDCKIFVPFLNTMMCFYINMWKNLKPSSSSYHYPTIFQILNGITMLSFSFQVTSLTIFSDIWSQITANTFVWFSLTNKQHLFFKHAAYQLGLHMICFT